MQSLQSRFVAQYARGAVNKKVAINGGDRTDEISNFCRAIGLNFAESGCFFISTTITFLEQNPSKQLSPKSQLRLLNFINKWHAIINQQHTKTDRPFLEKLLRREAKDVVSLLFDNEKNNLIAAKFIDKMSESLLFLISYGDDKKHKTLPSQMEKLADFLANNVKCAQLGQHIVTNEVTSDKVQQYEKHESSRIEQKACLKFKLSIGKMKATSVQDIPLRTQPIRSETVLYKKAGNQDSSFINAFPIIAKGNHAEVMRAGRFVVKDLGSEESNEIWNIKSGISIMSQFGETTLFKNNLLLERIIYDSALHSADSSQNLLSLRPKMLPPQLQYAAIRMEGDAVSSKIPKHNIKIAKEFFRDATKAVLFLNANLINYGNLKPENFVYSLEKLPDGSDNYTFYLQDYGKVAQFEEKLIDTSRGQKLLWSFEGSIGGNEYMNKALYDKMCAYTANGRLGSFISRIGAARLLKIRNLSGLIFTCYAFHFGRIPDSFNHNFSKFLQELGITDIVEIGLIFNLCFCTVQNLPSPEELNKIEEILARVTH